MVEPPRGSAEVAEQADASVSKTDVRKDVRVRLPLSAPRRYQTVWKSIRLHPFDIARSPAQRILELTGRIGEAETAAWCAGLLDGSISYTDPARPPINWLGGRHAAALQLRHGGAWGGQDHWPRVWAARGLLYVWDPSAEASILAGLHDRAWRTREMCAKVARRRAIGRAEPILARLLDDPTPRVRAAAESALAALLPTAVPPDGPDKLG